MKINAAYAKAPVGTGVFTRNMIRALPEAATLDMPPLLLRRNAISFWSKRAHEFCSSSRRGPILHPYWPTSLGRGNIPTILDFFQYDEATPFERRLLSLALQSAGALLTISREVASQIRPVAPDQPLVVAHPFPDDSWFMQRRGSAMSGGVIRIAYFGGFHPRKAIRSALDMLARSPVAGRVEIHTTGSGDIAPYEPLRLVSHGVLSLSQTIDLVDSCDVVLYPSEAEGFGLPVFEALLRKKPVVARPLRVYGEFCRGPGLFYPEDWGDPGAVADALMSASAWRPVPREESLLRSSVEECTETLRGALLSAVHEVSHR